LLSIAATATTATAFIATTVVKLAVIHCQRKRQQQQHHQHTNGSTNIKTFTSPDNWTYLTIYSIEGVKRLPSW
jgi:hypothetical protein